jgi:adenylate kinase
MKVIIVSGTPGTGKTTISKKIAKEKGYLYVDVNEIINIHNKEYKIISGYDKKRDTKIIDVKKLNKVLVMQIKKYKQEKIKGIVIDSHLSHYLPKKYVDLCIITKCALKTLKKRLEKRNYSKEKIRENLDAEIFDVCRIEALEKGHKIKVIDTTKGAMSRKEYKCILVI